MLDFYRDCLYADRCISGDGCFVGLLSDGTVTEYRGGCETPTDASFRRTPLGALLRRFVKTRQAGVRGMDAKNWKYVLWTIAYAIGLVLVVLRIEDILRAAGAAVGAAAAACVRHRHRLCAGPPLRAAAGLVFAQAPPAGAAGYRLRHRGGLPAGLRAAGGPGRHRRARGGAQPAALCRQRRPLPARPAGRPQPPDRGLRPQPHRPERGDGLWWIAIWAA